MCKETGHDWNGNRNREACIADGHCGCIEYGRYHCHWCGWYNEAFAKNRELKTTETRIKNLLEKYSKETKLLLWELGFEEVKQ